MGVTETHAFVAAGSKGGSAPVAVPVSAKRDNGPTQRTNAVKVRAKPRESCFAPGTVLLREWGEQEHRVTVSAEGLFDYEGRSFKSLTAVARHITGSQWNGPLFFGLRGTRGAA